MKKVLIIAHSFPPSNAPAAQRPYYLAKCIAAHGYVPVVLTPAKTYSAHGHSEHAAFPFEVVTTDNYTNENLYKAKRENKKSKGLLFRLKSFFFTSVLPELLIPDKGMLWKRYAKKRLKSYPNDTFDLVFSTSPSVVNHQVASFASEYFNIPWVADFRDFYYTNHIENKDFKFRKRFDALIEKRVVKKADYLTFVTNSMLNAYCDKYEFIKDRSVRIYNGFDLDDLVERKKESLSFPIKVFYAGSFYGGMRSPLPFLKIIEEAISQKELRIQDVNITIAGNIDTATQKLFNQTKISESINFLGQISKNAVEEYMKSADMLWMITADDKNHSMTIPLKFFDYLKTGKPILSFGPAAAEVNNLMRSVDCGLFLENTEDNDGVKHNKEQFLSYFSSMISQFEKTKKSNIENLSRQFQAKEFAEIFDRITK